jgi:hypothetical protein
VNDPFRVADEAAFYARRFPWSALADAAACFGAVPPDAAAPPALPDPAHHDDWPNAIHWYGPSLSLSLSFSLSPSPCVSQLRNDEWFNRKAMVVKEHI